VPDGPIGGTWRGRTLALELGEQGLEQRGRRELGWVVGGGDVLVARRPREALELRGLVVGGRRGVVLEPRGELLRETCLVVVWLSFEVEVGVVLVV